MTLWLSIGSMARQAPWPTVTNKQVRTVSRCKVHGSSKIEENPYRSDSLVFGGEGSRLDLALELNGDGES